MGSEYYRLPDWETRLRTVTHSIGLVVAAFLLAAVSSLFAASLLRSAGVAVQPLSEVPPLPYAVLSAAQFVGFFAAVGAYLAWRNYPDLFDVGLPDLRDLGLIVGGLVALLGLNVVIGVAFEAFGVESATNSVVEQGQQDPERFLYMIPVTLLFVAPSEELLFRGVVQGLFRRAYGVLPALLFASAIFGFGHWLALQGTGGGKLAYVASAAALGLLLGALYELSENVAVPIVVHGLYNSMLFASQYASAT